MSCFSHRKPFSFNPYYSISYCIFGINHSIALKPTAKYILFCFWLIIFSSAAERISTKREIDAIKCCHSHVIVYLMVLFGCQSIEGFCIPRRRKDDDRRYRMSASNTNNFRANKTESNDEILFYFPFRCQFSFCRIFKHWLTESTLSIEHVEQCVAS